MEPVCICTMENVPLKVVSNWPQKLHFVLHAAAALSALVKVKFVKKKFVKKIHQKNSSKNFFKQFVKKYVGIHTRCGTVVRDFESEAKTR